MDSPQGGEKNELEKNRHSNSSNNGPLLGLRAYCGHTTVMKIQLCNV
jgi:hypothetical protein